jgi:transcriptional regulator with XRE-family HTH domain
MPASVGSPGDEDEPVGIILARMRRAKRITGAELAALVGMSQPKISRIERGKGLVNPEDIGIIARALGADGAHAQVLMDRVEQSRDRMTDWRPTSAGLTGQQKTIGDWEVAATAVRDFQPVLVPGLLQTSGYAKSVLQSFQRLAPLTEENTTESELLATVSARIKRQEVLASSAKNFQFIMGEAALKSGRHSFVEMLAQISQIRELAARHTNVNVVIVPDSAPADVPLLHGFTVFDDELVVIDLYNTGLISRSRRDVQTYHRVFTTLEEHATDIAPFLDRYETTYIEMLQRSQNP